MEKLLKGFKREIAWSEMWKRKWIEMVGGEQVEKDENGRG